MNWKAELIKEETAMLSVSFASIPEKRRNILDELCIVPPTEAEGIADDERWEKLFKKQAKGLSKKEQEDLFYRMFTSADEPEPLPETMEFFWQEVKASQDNLPQNDLEHQYVTWRSHWRETQKREELAEEKAQAENVHNAKLALIQAVITSSVKEHLQSAEMLIVRREQNLCLHKLTDKELLLFIFLTGYRWHKEKKKTLSMVQISWLLDLGTTHPQTTARAKQALELKYPPIKSLIASFRTRNAKGELREKYREISTDGMNDAERQKLGLDDGKEEEN